MKPQRSFLLALALLVSVSFAQGPSPFRLDKVVGAFEQMRSTPGFDVSRPLQWGYFFVAPTQEPLAAIRSALEPNGYVYVESHVDPKGKHWLQLARVEVHTPESLHKRNQELFLFAPNFGGATYDGWDVTRR